MNEEEEERIKLEAVKEMEMQLHEQFASNYNNGFSSTVTLFCSLLAVLYGYGYVFLHSSLTFTNGLDDLYNDGVYAIDALIFVGIAVTIVLFIMKYICTYQGISVRLEQFMVYSIRCKYYDKKPVDLEHRIYPSNYHPFKGNDKDYSIGLYSKFGNILWGILLLSEFGIGIKIFCSMIRGGLCGLKCCTAIMEISALFIVFIVCYILCSKGEEKLKNKYIKQSSEYVEYKYFKSINGKS